MNAIGKVVILFAAASVSVLGQNGSGPKSQDSGVPPSHDLGGKRICIPAPEHFTDTIERFPLIAGRLLASETPLNEVLAAHIDDSILPLLKDGGEPDIPFYTKASVPKHLKSTDISSDEFRALAAELKRQPPLALQSALKKQEADMDSRISEFWGVSANMKVGETRTIGHFNEQPNAISSLFVTHSEAFGRRFLTIGSMSLVHVNDRLLFLYVFRTTADPQDQSAVIDITKGWIARTLQANR
ncbi:MAG: hypothetical protein AB7Q37_08050 [Pyrinomonadaceae bacterium]